MDGEPGPVGSGGLADADGDESAAVPAALLDRWRAAEHRLYPMVMVIPEGYERVVRLVGETTVELQLACRDLAALVDEAPRVPERVRRLAEEAGLGDGLDLAMIGAAACLLRYRQLEAEVRHEQRIRRIAAAADSGATWVVLAQGTPPTTWPPLPSTTLEMHLASGRALEQTITIDAETGAARFGLAEVALDPETGERRPGEVGQAEFSAEFAELEPWRAAVAERRRHIELGH